MEDGAVTAMRVMIKEALLQGDCFVSIHFLDSISLLSIDQACQGPMVIPLSQNSGCGLTVMNHCLWIMEGNS